MRALSIPWRTLLQIELFLKDNPGPAYPRLAILLLNGWRLRTQHQFKLISHREVYCFIGRNIKDATAFSGKARS